MSGIRRIPKNEEYPPLPLDLLYPLITPPLSAYDAERAAHLQRIYETAAEFNRLHPTPEDIPE